MRVIPVKARALPPGGRNAYFVLEALAGMHMHEDIVAVSPRRHAHAVIVHVRWRAGAGTERADEAGIIRRRTIGQIVAEIDPQRIAEARPQGRRHVIPVVEHSREFVIAEPDRSARRRQRGFENTVAAADFRRRNERLACLARPRAIARSVRTEVRFAAPFAPPTPWRRAPRRKATRAGRKSACERKAWLLLKAFGGPLQNRLGDWSDKTGRTLVAAFRGYRANLRPG